MKMEVSSATVSVRCFFPRPRLLPQTHLLSASKSPFLVDPSINKANQRLVLSQTRPRRNGVRKGKGGLSCNCLFGLGVPELVVIAGVAALVFGPKQLPEVGRSIGKTVKSFQQAAKEFESELRKDPDTTQGEGDVVENTKASAVGGGEKDDIKSLNL
ncbi:hypothetical protein Dimus_021803 [Dionaea muscipula]